MNDEAVYRTAPATPGLLIIDYFFMLVSKTWEEGMREGVKEGGGLFWWVVGVGIKEINTFYVGDGFPYYSKFVNQQVYASLRIYGGLFGEQLHCSSFTEEQTSALNFTICLRCTYLHCTSSLHCTALHSLLLCSALHNCTALLSTITVKAHKSTSRRLCSSSRERQASWTDNGL